MGESRSRKELRIGLVLYGGVSLAVYMHGVVTEIWNALRASALRVKPPKGTTAVYLELMHDIKKLCDGNDLRIVVDTIAGTSAGGVNGVVLGKAIATGGDASVLDDTWIKEAGIGQLKAQAPENAPWWFRLGDNVLAVRWSGFKKLRRFLDRTPGINWEWARDHIYSLFTSDNPRKTPLDGDYFTRMIAGTLEDMAPPVPGPKLIPPGGWLDLVLTGTDLHGWPRHLPVEPRFHKDLLETAHAHRMHFRFRRPLGQPQQGGSGDFDEDFGLTYAARVTAGFPIAFAPVSYRTTARSFKKERFNDPFPDKDAFAVRHLPEHHLAGYKASKVWMVDGGILDNKPFSAAIRLIEEKPANRAVYRTLMYIEPDPALVEGTKPARSMPFPRMMPGLLYKLVRHEPIFADLHVIAARNRLIQRLTAIADAAEVHGERVMRAALARQQLDLERLHADAHDHLRNGNNPSYHGYTVLKARRVAGTLAGSLSEALGYPYESRHGYFVRQVVRGFFQKQDAFDPPEYNEDTQTYDSYDSQVDLLKAFDLPYRLRRLRYLVRVANDQYGNHEIDAEKHKALDTFKLALMQAAFEFEELTAWGRGHGEEINAFIRSHVGEPYKPAIVPSQRAEVLYRWLRRRFNRVMSGQGKEVHRAILNLPPPLREHLVYRWLRRRFNRIMNEQGQAVRIAISNLPSPLRERLARAYVVYPMIDAAIFPMMDSAGVRDLSTIRVFRISPHDATTLSSNPRRLKSRELGAFAGFLRRDSREHDLLWGRLDGAERLIDLIIAAGVNHTQQNKAQSQSLRVKALNAAFKIILDEAESGASIGLCRVIARLRKKFPITP